MFEKKGKRDVVKGREKGGTAITCGESSSVSSVQKRDMKGQHDRRVV